MTIEHYRLMVALRWVDLESISVKGTPMKKNLQALRKRREWPTCDVYDPCSSGDTLGESLCSGSERYRRCRQRKTNPPMSGDDGVEVIVVRKIGRNVGLRGLGDLRDCSFVECDSAGNSIVEEPTSSSQEGGPQVVGNDSSEELIDGTVKPNYFDNSFFSKYFHEPRQSREYKRAVRNNLEINEQLRKLRKKRSELIAWRRKTVGEEYSRLTESLSFLESGIAKLVKQRSDSVSPGRDGKGGLQVPPPESLNPAPRNRRPQHHSTKDHRQRRTVPIIPLIAHDRATGGSFYICGECRGRLNSTPACTNGECSLGGQPTQVRIRVHKYGRERWEWRWP
jgi:hypothetical protein